ALGEGGAEDAVEAGRRGALPGNRCAGFLLGEAEHRRVTERRRQEKTVADLTGRRDRHTHVRGVFFRPVDLAGLRVEAMHGFRVPDDKLTLAASLVNHRWTVTRLLGRERSPEFLASVLVEGNGSRALATDHADELLAIQQRMRGETPQGRLNLVVVLQFA